MTWSPLCACRGLEGPCEATTASSHRGALGPGQRPVLNRIARCRSWEDRADLGVWRTLVSPVRLKRSSFAWFWITRGELVLHWFHRLCVTHWWLSSQCGTLRPLQMLWAHLRGFLYLSVCSCTDTRQAEGQKEVPFVIESPWQYRIS